MKFIHVKDITKNNLKNFSVKIPLQKLVTIVGPSGSGKSSLVHEVLYENTIKKEYDIENLPKKIEILEQKVILPKDCKQSLGEFNLEKLKTKLSHIQKDELLIVDEPCAGFCKKEREIILKLLQEKVKKGYSIIAVEHNKEIISNADYIIELGPGAGRYGGKLIFEGPLDKFKKANTITSKHVFNEDKISPNYAKHDPKKVLTISKINLNNIKNESLSFPIKNIVCITGASGTGKTTLLEATYRALYKGRNAWQIKLKGVNIQGKAFVRRSYLVPQSPIGDHPSSTLATYAKVWDNIREIYASQELSKKLKLSKADFIITKSIVDNKDNFSENALKIYYQKRNITDIMQLTIDEALEIFKNNSLITRKLKYLEEAGLGYLVLGQRSSSLSGGEAQRVRIANIISKKLGDRCIYIFDTPSRGLHLKDIPILIKSFRKIINKNNTILIADNREEIFEFCDFKINL